MRTPRIAATRDARRDRRRPSGTERPCASGVETQPGQAASASEYPRLLAHLAGRGTPDFRARLLDERGHLQAVGVGRQHVIHARPDLLIAKNGMAHRTTIAPE